MPNGKWLCTVIMSAQMFAGYLREVVWVQVRKKLQTHTLQQAILAQQPSDIKNRGPQTSQKHL